MSKKKIIALAIFVIVGLAVWYGYREYRRENPDIAGEKADFILPAAQLVRDYENNEQEANSRYNGKIVEVKGLVKSIEQDERGYFTIVLGEKTGSSSVRCSMDTTHNEEAASVKTGDSVSVRGACTGFNRDEMGLGSDAMLNRCVVIDSND